MQEVNLEVRNFISENYERVNGSWRGWLPWWREGKGREEKVQFHTHATIWVIYTEEGRQPPLDGHHDYCGPLPLFALLAPLVHPTAGGRAGEAERAWGASEGLLV